MGTEREGFPGGGERANATTDLAGKAREKARDQFAVVAGADGGVEVDQLDQGIFREALGPVVEVVKVEGFLFALYQLDDLATHEVDGRNEHSC